MATSWEQFCNAEDLAVIGSSVTVSITEHRTHNVMVHDAEEAIVLRAYVARQKVVGSTPNLPVLIWQRNRTTKLVGFRIDRKNRLVGESWVPKVGLTMSEFQLYLRRVAIESDRFEYLLTGRDRE